MAIFPGEPGLAGTRKVSILDFIEVKSLLTNKPTHIFYTPNAVPSRRLTNSVKALNVKIGQKKTTLASMAFICLSCT